MVCIYCASETQVINSRHQKRSNGVWRRRKCTNCHNIFTTLEQLDYEKSWSVQPNTQPFLRDKLLMSVHTSLQHRPTALPDALGITDTIVGKLGRITQNGQLTTTAIATLTYETLRRFDKVAATVYQAYHKSVM